MITEADIQLRFIQSLSFRNVHIASYVDDVNLITAREETPVLADGFSFGKSKIVYKIKNDDREFYDITSLVSAYNELFKHSEDNPDTEIVYVKVKRKRT